MYKNPTEKLAHWTLSRLLPEGSEVVLIEDQSNGEHDFDVFDEQKQKVAIIEVTGAVHQNSKKSIAIEHHRGPIQNAPLQYGWLLMAHNPGLIKSQNAIFEHLGVLETHRCNEFNHHTQYAQNAEVSQAAKALHRMCIENGEGGNCPPGTVAFLVSRGENSDDWILSHERVIEVVADELNKADNLRKLSEMKNPDIDRHFFVGIDQFTNPAAGYSMAETEPPSEPPDINNCATHIWAAMRANDEVIVWGGCATGWKSWSLPADDDLDHA